MEASVCHSPHDSTKEFPHARQALAEGGANVPEPSEVARPAAPMMSMSLPAATARLERQAEIDDNNFGSTTAAGVSRSHGSPVNSDDVNHCHGATAVKPKQSPVTVSPAGGGGAHSVGSATRRSTIEERARRFGGNAVPSPSSISPKTSPESSSLLWWRATPSPCHGNGGSGANDAIAAISTRCSGENQPRQPTTETLPAAAADLFSSDTSKPFVVPPPSSSMQTRVGQAPPPAEVVQLPVVVPLPTTTLSIFFEDNILSQSARVEPSPERFFAPPEACQDLIRPAEVETGEDQFC